MKTIAKIGLALSVFAMVGYAENVSGKLIDSACHDRSSQQSPGEPSQKGGGGEVASCAATASTTSFAIETSDGKVYKLDASGNAKASTALKGNPANKSPMATVSGSTEGQTVKVDSISIQ